MSLIKKFFSVLFVIVIVIFAGCADDPAPKKIINVTELYPVDPPETLSVEINYPTDNMLVHGNTKVIFVAKEIIRARALIDGDVVASTSEKVDHLYVDFGGVPDNTQHLLKIEVWNSAGQRGETKIKIYTNQDEYRQKGEAWLDKFSPNRAKFDNMREISVVTNTSSFYQIDHTLLNQVMQEIEQETDLRFSPQVESKGVGDNCGGINPPFEQKIYITVKNCDGYPGYVVLPEDVINGVSVFRWAWIILKSGTPKPEICPTCTNYANVLKAEMLHIMIPYGHMDDAENPVFSAEVYGKVGPIMDKYGPYYRAHYIPIEMRAGITSLSQKK